MYTYVTMWCHYATLSEKRRLKIGDNVAPLQAQMQFFQHIEP